MLLGDGASFMVHMPLGPASSIRMHFIKSLLYTTLYLFFYGWSAWPGANRGRNCPALPSQYLLGWWGQVRLRWWWSHVIPFGLPLLKVAQRLHWPSSGSWTGSWLPRWPTPGRPLPVAYQHQWWLPWNFCGGRSRQCLCSHYHRPCIGQSRWYCCQRAWWWHLWVPFLCQSLPGWLGSRGRLRLGWTSGWWSSERQRGRCLWWILVIDEI